LLKNTTKIPLDRLDRALAPDLQRFWRLAATAADARGWELYLVGGAVRDLLLSGDRTVTIPDLDLVVSAHPTTPAGAAILLAQDLQKSYPDSRLAERAAFQTATLHYGLGSPLENRAIDLATARIEAYAHPGAHPIVTAGSIYEDLQRRDFTINAMALCLTGETAGTIVDFFGGQQDLADRTLRVLHDRSFADDPTRLFRGVRFLTRLDLQWAEETRQQWQEILNSSLFVETLAQFEKVPSLQSRLTAELKYLSDSSHWSRGIQEIQTLGGWRCIHPQLQIDRETQERLNLLDRLGGMFDLPSLWQMRLETILAGLNLLDRQTAAAQLQLPPDSIHRLSQLETVENILATSGYQPPSQLSITLSPFSTPLLFQTLLWQDAPENLWLYLTKWSKVTAPLDGRDLQALGYPPGATYKIMLQDLLGAVRDERVVDRQSALEFLSDRYPLKA
jgi:tRNA nucleotidyltransferase (CCA-adding enzyme)